MPKQKSRDRKGGTFTPSDRIKKTISNWEGDAMTKVTWDPNLKKWVKPNIPFEEVARAFYNIVPQNIRSQVFANQDLSDYLYSYAYNVGIGNFRDRVVPALQNYFNGNGSIDEITSSMWSHGEKKKNLRGLRIRRAAEKEGVRKALSSYNAKTGTKNVSASDNLNFGDFIMPDAIRSSRPMIQPTPRVDVRSDYTDRTTIAPPPLLDINQSGNTLYNRMQRRAENRKRNEALMQQMHDAIYNVPQYQFQPAFGGTVQPPYAPQPSYARGKNAFPFWNRFGNTMSLRRY